MPRDITVTFSDGTQHIYKNAPDDVSPEQAQSRAEQEFGKPVKALDGGVSGDTMSMPEKVLRRLTAGFGKASGAAAGGLVNLANMNPIVAALRARVAMGAKDPSTLVPQAIDAVASNTTGEAQRYFGEIGDKAKMNPYPASFIEGVGGAVANPLTAVAPVQSVVSAGTGNVGGELAARTLGEGPMQRLVGSFVGSLLGGGAVNKIGQASPNTMTLAKESMEGITPEQINAAKSFMEASAAKGVKIDLAQALEATGVPASNITTVRNVLANSKHGNQVQALLRNQPQDLEALADITTSSMPGNVRSADVAANNLQQAASDTIQAAKNSRSSAVKADYAKAGPLSEDARAQMVATARSIMNRPGATDEVKAILGNFVKKISGAAEGAGNAAVEAARAKVAAATTPSARMAAQQELAAANEAAAQAAAPKPLHALDADTAIGEVAGSYKGALLTPTNPKTAGQLKFAAGELNKILTDASAETKAAASKFATISRTVVDPLKQGLTGQFATPRGARPDVAASRTKFAALMEAGEDPNASYSPIQTFAKQLKSTDPEAFPDAVKSYLSQKVGKAFPPHIGGGKLDAPEAASKLWDSLFSNRSQWNGLRQAAAASAESLGQKPADVVRGLEQFAQITKAVKSRPSSVGGLQRQELFELSGKSYGADALRMFGFLPFEKAARGVENRIMASTFKNFDKLLTTPEGAAKLAELGKAPIMSKRAILIFNSIGAGERGLEQGLANLEEPAGK